MKCAECDKGMPSDTGDYLCWSCRNKDDERVKNPIRPPVMLGDLKGPEGNAFVILGRCAEVWKEAQRENLVDPQLSFDAISEEMKSGDYENLLRVCEKYFTPYVSSPTPLRVAEDLYGEVEEFYD